MRNINFGFVSGFHLPLGGGSFTPNPLNGEKVVDIIKKTNNRNTQSIIGAKFTRGGLFRFTIFMREYFLCITTPPFGMKKYE